VRIASVPAVIRTGHPQRTSYLQTNILCLSVYLSIYLRFYSPLLNLDRFFSFLNFLHSRYDSLAGDQTVAKPLPAHRTAQIQNKGTQTTMPQVSFEPTIPVFERAKTVHALDRAATVIGTFSV
jgi:hypothetical protein